MKRGEVVYKRGIKVSYIMHARYLTSHGEIPLGDCYNITNPETNNVKTDAQIPLAAVPEDAAPASNGVAI